MPIKIVNDKLKFKRTITLEILSDSWFDRDKDALRAKELLYLGGIESGTFDNVKITKEDGVIDRTGKYIPNWKLGRK